MPSQQSTTLERIRQALQEAKATAPVVGKLLNGTIDKRDLPELASVCDAFGVPEVGHAVRQIEAGAPTTDVLAMLVSNAGLMPILSELGETAGDATDLVRIIKGLMRSV